MNNRKSAPEISVIIPAYNEGKRLPVTLPLLRDYLKAKFESFEIIVVNDGSTDNTVQFLSHFDLPELKLLDLAENRGKGFAVRTGVAAAQGELILFSDADLSTPPEETEKLLAALNQGHDIAIGSRALRDSQILKPQPTYRMCMGKIFNRLVRLLALNRFADTQCGFKCFRSQAAKTLFALGQVDGFSFDVEILFLAARSNYSIKEVGIAWQNDEASKVNPLGHSLQMLKDLARIRFLNLSGSYEKTGWSGCQAKPEDIGKQAATCISN